MCWLGGRQEVKNSSEGMEELFTSWLILSGAEGGGRKSQTQSFLGIIPATPWWAVGMSDSY